MGLRICTSGEPGDFRVADSDGREPQRGGGGEDPPPSHSPLDGGGPADSAEWSPDLGCTRRPGEEPGAEHVIAAEALPPTSAP